MSESTELKTEQLATYLNDHLAGAAAAVDLLEHLAKKFPESDLGAFFAELHIEITADQEVVSDLLKVFEAKESAVRKAGAWIAEKFGQAKFSLKENDLEGVGLLEALEALVLGITGKQLLWRSLTVASRTLPQLRGPDYADLEQRATAQRDRVEAKRLVVARDAFTDQG